MPRTNRAYWRLISFLKGERDVSSDREFAIAAVVSRRSFLSKDQAVELVGRMLTPERFAEVAARDIAFARDLFRAVRSEEHTSELQSLMRISYAVFCLNKKKKYNIHTSPQTQYT